MVPMMYTKVTFPSHSRGIAWLTQSEGDCTANKPQLTETAMEGMQQERGKQRRRKTSLLDTREVTSKNGKKPPALLIQY